MEADKQTKGADEQPLAQNENPRANENIRVRTDDSTTTKEKTDAVGSEITDGEAG